MKNKINLLFVITWLIISPLLVFITPLVWKLVIYLTVVWWIASNLSKFVVANTTKEESNNPLFDFIDGAAAVGMGIFLLSSPFQTTTFLFTGMGLSIILTVLGAHDIAGALSKLSFIETKEQEEIHEMRT